MKPGAHVSVSFSVAIIIAFATKSLYNALLCFVGGVLVDVDHIIEHAIHYGIKDITIKRLYEAGHATGTQQEGGYKKIYLIFHSVELCVLLWLFYAFTRNIYVASFSIGYSLHLLMDYIGNETIFGTYFFIWRASTGFSAYRSLRR